MSEKIKVLIVVNSGVAELIAATGPVDVTIMDKDSNGEPPVIFSGGIIDPISEEEFNKRVDENCCACGECSNPIRQGEESFSGYCGSIHESCVDAHKEKCEVCRKHL